MEPDTEGVYADIQIDTDSNTPEPGGYVADGLMVGVWRKDGKLCVRVEQIQYVDAAA